MINVQIKIYGQTATDKDIVRDIIKEALEARGLAVSDFDFEIGKECFSVTGELISNKVWSKR